MMPQARCKALTGFTVRRAFPVGLVDGHLRHRMMLAPLRATPRLNAGLCLAKEVGK
jgi:hypothetical protein